VCSHSLEIHASWMAPTTHPTQHVNITLTKVPLTLLAFISHTPFIVHLTQHITKLLTKVLTCIRGFNFSRDIHGLSMHYVDSRHLFGKFSLGVGLKFACLE
jgi:hypothetical protein